MTSTSRYTSVPGEATDEADSASSTTRPASSAGRCSQRDTGLVHHFARAGVAGSTAFVLICLFLSLMSWHQSGFTSSSGSASKSLSSERRRDRTMNEATCKAEFPLLFPQIQDNVAAWQAKGGISYTDLDQAARTCAGNWGMARIVIRDGQLFLRQVREGGESRISALLHLVHTAVTTDPSSFTSADDPSNTGVELVLSEADKDASPTSDAVWVLSKRTSEPKSKGTWLLPDFGFAGWPETGIASFAEFLHLASLQDHLVPWSHKADRVLWRGLANGYAPRVDLISRTDPRKVPGAEKWADVLQTSFHDVGDDFHPIIPMHHHCRHKFLVQTEGNSYSGRGKFLWSCRSVTVAHPMEWTQHFHAALNSNANSRQQNMVELRGPLFSGLEETVKQLQATAHIPSTQDLAFNYTNGGGALKLNPPQRIAENAVESLRNRYLTPAATNCYLRAAIKAYARVLKKDTWPREENAAAWDVGGVGIVPHGGPGGGVAPGSGKAKDLAALAVKGDIEYGVWRLIGSPDWPPVVAKPK
ncbi:uncharacterized protein UMAG_10184 [Mycosarcoma maydis]|uniref:Glycosyl transferase CAP10 domain-containing protein n=1 Tax=Mycosarcoma maydis TaxID=5270 RepID=A0A0D1E2L8_MYCMD|nr:uncharacterized protein UMAG_10184 [Ustilago maydis 521]KIS70076.1 hypothetical protein UMAG_10184 [Ustilago maydis 521]|eukprot:XP_011388347.1 hypothetical protein UMAG_10184 [Ustilago maydis 521]